MTPFEFKNNQLNEECIGLCMYSITPKSIQATCTHFCSVHKKKSLKHKFSLQFSFTFFFFLIFLDFCTSFVSAEAARHRSSAALFELCLPVSIYHQRSLKNHKNLSLFWKWPEDTAIEWSLNVTDVSCYASQKNTMASSIHCSVCTGARTAGLIKNRNSKGNKMWGKLFLKRVCMTARHGGGWVSDVIFLYHTFHKMLFFVC